MRVNYGRAALCCALAVAACDDLGTGASGGEGARAESPAPPPSLDRFELEMNASGSFRPGQPIQITARATANLRSQGAEVRVVLPEVASARETNWRGPRFPQGRGITPELAERVAMARGQGVTRAVNVTIPEPGYYRVVASVVQDSVRDDERPDDERLVQTVAHRDLYLWISEDGGRVTEEFDPALFGSAYHQVLGPLTPIGERRPFSQPRTGTPDRPAFSVAGVRPQTTGVAGWVDIRSTYYNYDANRLDPIPNAYFEYLIYDSSGRLVDTRTGFTNADGLSYTQCYTDATGRPGTFRFRLLLDNARVTMSLAGALDLTGDFAANCGYEYTEQVTGYMQGTERAHIFSQMDRALRYGDSFFGYAGADIFVRLDPNRRFSTWLQASNEVVIATQPDSIYGDQIWGPYGAFVQAHEYGHAYHQTYLGGFYRYYNNCPEPHPMDAQITSLGCTLAEAFPDYYSVVTMGALTGYIGTDMESGRWIPGKNPRYAAGTDGSTIQGAVASFLYDITDPANETHDRTAYPGRYMADLFRTCRAVRSVNPTYNVLNEGIDHLVYCMQQQVSDTYLFTFRTYPPTSYSEQAAEPASWNRADVVAVRNWNLFGR